MEQQDLVQLNTVQGDGQVIPSPLSTKEAWAIYRQFLALPVVCWLAEPAGTDTFFQDLSSGNGFVHRLWTDADLAALAQANPCRLVSFDADFKRFAGLSFLHLSSPAE